MIFGDDWGGKKSRSLCIDELESLVDLASESLHIGALFPRVGLASGGVDEFDLRQLLLQGLMGCLCL